MQTDHHRFTRWLDGEHHSQIDVAECYDHQINQQENTSINELQAEKGASAK